MHNPTSKFKSCKWKEWVRRSVSDVSGSICCKKKRRYFWTTLHWAQFIISDAFSKEYIWKLFISISKSTCCKVSSWSDCWNTHAFGGLKPWWCIQTKTQKSQRTHVTFCWPLEDLLWQSTGYKQLSLTLNES